MHVDQLQYRSSPSREFGYRSSYSNRQPALQISSPINTNTTVQSSLQNLAVQLYSYQLHSLFCLTIGYLIMIRGSSELSHQSILIIYTLLTSQYTICTVGTPVLGSTLVIGRVSPSPVCEKVFMVRLSQKRE